jgi:tRNA pseudouridine38-40 synthase
MGHGGADSGPVAGLAGPGPRDDVTGPHGHPGVRGQGARGPGPGEAESPATPASGADPDSLPPGTAPVRIRLDIGYDGTGFSGWARQPGRRTVQGTLEDALARVLNLAQPAALTVAGRTDAGVHARGQVAHADIPAESWAEDGHAAVRRLARLLPPDVRVHRITPAPPGFDARFSALWRRYAYRVCDDPAAADPLARHTTLWYRSRLDVEAMNEAARGCLGEHDFAAFCRRREGASTVRALLRLDWARPGPAVAEATVVADAFCHNMVRALVGAMLKVGDGSRPPAWPAEVLAAGIRDPAVPVVGPHGLCLEEVGYPADNGLAARAALARNPRPAPPAAPPATARPAATRSPGA